MPEKSGIFCKIKGSCLVEFVCNNVKSLRME